MDPAGSYASKHHHASPATTQTTPHQHISMHAAPYPPFLYSYAQHTSITIADKRSDMKAFLMTYDAFERDIGMVNPGLLRGLQSYALIKYAIVSQELGTTPSLSLIVSRIISQTMTMDQLKRYQRHMDRMPGDPTNHLMGVQLLETLFSFGFLRRDAVDSILLMQTAFELQDTQVIRAIYMMYLSTRCEENLSAPQQESESSPSIHPFVECYMYILGQVKMMHSQQSCRDVLQLWRTHLETQFYSVPDPIFMDIAPLIVEACDNARIERAEAESIVEKIFETLNRHGLYPSAELVRAALAHHHILPLESLLEKYSLRGTTMLSYAQLVAASRSALGYTSTEQGIRTFPFTTKPEPLPNDTQEALKDFVAQVVYTTFPKESFEFMTEEEREMWLMSRIREEHSSQLPALLKLYGWLQVIYGMHPSLKIFECFLQQIHRMESPSAMLSFILSLRVSLGRSALSDSIIALGMKQYFQSRVKSRQEEEEDEEKHEEEMDGIRLQGRLVEVV